MMEIDAALLDEIEAGAKKAGASSWKGMADKIKYAHSEEIVVCHNPNPEDGIGSARRARWNDQRNHIARMDPPTTLKLVEWIERLEMEKERREALDRVFAFCEEQAIAEDAIRGAPEDVLKGAKW